MGNYDVDEDERVGYDKTSPNGSDPVDQRTKFLNVIKQIESSGGKNVEHPIMNEGIHAGQQAIGNYGLMPNTIQELNNRARLNHQLTPEMQAVGRNPASIGAAPEIEQQYAQQLADRVLNKFHDPAMAAYSWNQGHNLTPEQVQQRDYLSHPYVQKFQKIWKALGGK